MARKPKQLEPARGLFLRGGIWWMRVFAPGLKPAQRSSGAPADDVQRANDIKAMLDTLDKQQHFDLLEAANVGKITLEELYARFIGNRLKEARSTINDLDLSPWVAKWEQTMLRERKPSERTVGDYVKQVRTLIPEDEAFQRSQLTEIAADSWLADLADEGCSGSTRRRYGAALKVFVKFARKHHALETNPLLEWKLPAANDPRQVWWTFKTLTAVLNAMPDGEPGSREEQEKVCILLMASTGMEVSAALATMGKDVNYERHMVFARGTKNAWRKRWVHVRQWAWLRVKKYAKPFVHDALLFPDVNQYTLLDHFYDAQTVLGMASKTYDPKRRHTDYKAEHTIHDLRHTFCYLAFTGEDGDEKKGLHYCKRALGHKDLVMSQRIYANFNLGDDVVIEDNEPMLDTGT